MRSREFVGYRERVKPTLGKRRCSEPRVGNRSSDGTDSIGVTTLVDGVDDGRLGRISRQYMIERSLQRGENISGVLQLLRVDIVGEGFEKSEKGLGCVRIQRIESTSERLVVAVKQCSDSEIQHCTAVCTPRVGVRDS